MLLSNNLTQMGTKTKLEENQSCSPGILTLLCAFLFKTLSHLFACLFRERQSDSVRVSVQIQAHEQWHMYDVRRQLSGACSLFPPPECQAQMLTIRFASWVVKYLNIEPKCSFCWFWSIPTFSLFILFLFVLSCLLDI